MTVDEKKALAQTVLEAGSACKEFKETAQNYLNAIGTDGEKAAAAIMVAEAKEDINSIDDTIAFLSTDLAKQFFGEDGAVLKLQQAKEHKANGGIYCDCPGCTAAKAVMDAEAEIC